PRLAPHPPNSHAAERDRDASGARLPEARPGGGIGCESVHRDDEAVNPAMAVLDELPERWARWRLGRNRRGTWTLLWIVLSLYPSFGVLDWMLAPRSALQLLWGTRFIVVVVTLAMFRIVRTGLFDRHPDTISSAYMLLCAFGISLMTVFMGGLASPYYAGLPLAIVATGLLFVWPAHVVLITHTSIVASFVISNL